MFNLGADLCVDLGVGLGVGLGVSLGMKAWNYYPIRGGLRLVKQWSMTSKLWSTCSNDQLRLIHTTLSACPTFLSHNHLCNDLCRYSYIQIP